MVKLRFLLNKMWNKISSTFLGRILQFLHISELVRNLTYFLEFITNANKKTKDFFIQNSNKVNQILGFLEDDFSKDVYKAVLKFRCTSLRHDLLKVWQKNQYFDDCICLTDKESFVDCGAYTGDTIASFLKNVMLKYTGGGYENVYAFEPDPKNSEILKSFVASNNLKNVEVFTVATGKEKGVAFFETGETENASSKLSDKENSAADIFKRNTIEVEVNSLDNLLKNKKVTFIKMDIEGAETDAINGAKQIIASQRPKLAICIYHSNLDMVNLPILIKSMVTGEYKFYIRHYSDTWVETVFYAVPA